MTQPATRGWALSAAGANTLLEILRSEGGLPNTLGSAAYELCTRACLQPTTVRSLHAAGATLADLQGVGKRLVELSHRMSGRSDRILVQAAVYLASRASSLEGLQPSAVLDQAAAIAMVRELVRHLIPKARGLDTFAPRRRALSELLEGGRLSPEAYRALKGSDVREIRRLVGQERSLILEVVPGRNREVLAGVLDRVEATFGLPTLPALEALNAELASARRH